jgi:hypothetical protein
VAPASGTDAASDPPVVLVAALAVVPIVEFVRLLAARRPTARAIAAVRQNQPAFRILHAHSVELVGIVGNGCAMTLKTRQSYPLNGTQTTAPLLKTTTSHASPHQQINRLSCRRR